MPLITKPDWSYIWAEGGAIVQPSNTKIQTGWVAEVPPFQWENFVQNRQDQMLAHINQRGIVAWSGDTEYEAGGLSYVQGSNGTIYKSVAASGPTTTVQDPTTDVSDTYWTVAFPSSVQATETVQGIVELATTAEAEAGTDDDRAMTPLKVKQAIEQFSAGGIVGEIKPVASLTAPAKYLKCNGAAYLRASYPELFQKLVTDAGFTSQTFTVDIASPAVFTRTAHGFTGGERLRLSTTGTLPTGLNTTTDYFVDPLDANSFRLMTAVIGGTRVTTTGTQSGTHSYLQSWFGLGDGSTTFNVPDERANVLRGLDEGRGFDTGRSMGTQQRGSIIAADLQASGAGFSSNSPFSNTQLVANQYGQDHGTEADWSTFSNTVVLSGSLTPVVPIAGAYLLGRMRMQNGAYPFYIRYEA